MGVCISMCAIRSLASFTGIETQTGVIIDALLSRPGFLLQ